MTIKHHKSSRRKTPWDNQTKISPLELFIKQNYVKNYETKHPKIADTNEIELLNSFQLKECRHCLSTNIKKKGFTKNGIQRYWCNTCNHSFNILTNTLFDNHKISITEWIEFCLDIFNYESTNLTAKNNKNSITTATYWLNKLFIILEGIQEDIILDGDVYIDETFVSVVASDKMTKDGKQLRGLSKNQICIGIGFDGTNVFAKVEGYGKPSQQTTRQTFLSHINEKSHLIHDMERSHKILVDELNLTEDKYNSKEVKKLGDKDNPLNPINRQCFYLQNFLKVHNGLDRQHLQDYINLFCFIRNPPHDQLEKIKIIIDWVISNPKKLKYREIFQKNDD